MYAGGALAGEHRVSLESPKALRRVTSVPVLSFCGDEQFGMFRQERKRGNLEAANEHLRLAAMYGHQTARELLMRRRKKEKEKKTEMKTAEII
jgi:GH24 family phage-related lysozyme (muramidase)